MQKDPIQFLKKIANINSGTYNKSGVDKIGDIFSKELRGLGFKEKVYKSKDFGNLRYFASKKSSDKTNTLLSGHLDTVFEEDSGFLKTREDSKYIYGPGVYDMKGGLTIMLYALKELYKQNGEIKNIDVLLGPDEEIGSLAHRRQMQKIYEKYDYGLVFEPCAKQYELIEARKGISVYTIKTSGRAGHSAYYSGTYPNAIEVLTKITVKIAKLTSKKHETTINFGIISGGEKTNIIADTASLQFDLRYWTKKEFNRVMKELQKITKNYGASLTIDASFPAMESKDTQKIKKLVQDTKVTYIARPGASDASMMSACGISVLDGLGPSGGNFHSDKEKAVKISILKKIILTKLILTKLIK